MRHENADGRAIAVHVVATALAPLRAMDGADLSLAVRANFNSPEKVCAILAFCGPHKYNVGVLTPGLNRTGRYVKPPSQWVVQIN